MDDEDFDGPRAPTVAELTAIVDAWPVLLKALSKNGVLKPADRNAITFATKNRIEKRRSFETLLKDALQEPFQAREDKKRRPD